jgi:hypothetical protein
MGDPEDINYVSAKRCGYKYFKSKNTALERQQLLDLSGEERVLNKI